MPLHFSHFVRLTSRHFTSPPVLFASLHLTLCRFASPPFPCLTSRHFASPPVFFPTRFTSFHATSLHLPFVHLHFTPLHATSRRLLFFSHSLHLISRHFSSPQVLSASLHSTSCHFALPCFICLTSCHFTPPPVIFTSLHITSLHLKFCLPHFTPLYATSPHLPFFLPHFMPLHSTSPPFFSPHFASPHLIHPPASLRWQRFTKIVRKRPIQQTSPPASQPEYLSLCKRFGHSKDSNFFLNLSNVLNILLTSLFLQKIQIFEIFNSGESLK